MAIKIGFIWFSLMFFLISSCKKEKDLKNQITIKINSIDSESKKRRVNMFDTIVRMAKFGFPMRRYVKVAEYIIDSTGSVKIKIDSTKGYWFFLNGFNVYCSESFDEAFTKEKLNDGQEVNIEVISLENRWIHVYWTFYNYYLALNFANSSNNSFSFSVRFMGITIWYVMYKSPNIPSFL